MVVLERQEYQDPKCDKNSKMKVKMVEMVATILLEANIPVEIMEDKMCLKIKASQMMAVLESQEHPDSRGDKKMEVRVAEMETKILLEAANHIYKMITRATIHWQWNKGVHIPMEIMDLKMCLENKASQVIVILVSQVYLDSKGDKNVKMEVRMAEMEAEILLEQVKCTYNMATKEVNIPMETVIGMSSIVIVVRIMVVQENMGHTARDKDEEVEWGVEWEEE